MRNYDDPLHVGFPPMSRADLVKNYIAQADQAQAKGRWQIANAILDLAEATVRGEGGEIVFAKIRTASLKEDK